MVSARAKGGLGWLSVAVLVSSGALIAPAHPTGTSPPAQAWLGPFAELASDLEWIRFQRARLAGDQERALLHAENALALLPRSTEGWQLLATHLGFYLASTERAPELDRRRAWFQAALEVTRRGAERAEAPAELMLLRGILCLSKAENDPEIDVDGAPGLWRRAAAAFSEAAAAGHADAADYLGYTRSRASE